MSKKKHQFSVSFASFVFNSTLCWIKQLTTFKNNCRWYKKVWHAICMPCNYILIFSCHLPISTYKSVSNLVNLHNGLPYANELKFLCYWHHCNTKWLQNWFFSDSHSERIGLESSMNCPFSRFYIADLYKIPKHNEFVVLRNGPMTRLDFAMLDKL